MMLELTGVEAASLPQLAGISGVLAVWPWPPPADGRVDRARLTVSTDSCDGVLRQVLNWDGVHVAALGPELAADPERAGGAAGPQRPGGAEPGACQ